MKKKNRIIWYVALVLCGFVSGMLVTGNAKGLLTVGQGIVLPFEKLGAWIGRGISGFGDYFSSVKELQEENEALAEENRQLKKELQENALLEEENARLRDYLDIATAIDRTLEEGTVIGVGGSVTLTYVLNIGTKKGVTEGCAVLDTHGNIFGYVSETGKEWCRVVTLLDSASAVGAYLVKNDSVGILNGDYDLAQEGCCLLDYLPEDSEVAVGDIVYSTGIGSIYPGDLPIGEVVSVETDVYTRRKKATVRPYADMSRDVDYLVVVIDE